MSLRRIRKHLRITLNLPLHVQEFTTKGYASLMVMSMYITSLLRWSLILAFILTIVKVIYYYDLQWFSYAYLSGLPDYFRAQPESLNKRE